MKFVNLTSKDIILEYDYNSHPLLILRSGVVARIIRNYIPEESVDGIVIMRDCSHYPKTEEFEEIEGLPEREEGVFYIVEREVRERMGQHCRPDVLTPGESVNEKEGRYKNLAR